MMPILAEVLDDGVLGALSSELQSKVREDLESRSKIGKKLLPKDLNLLE